MRVSVLCFTTLRSMEIRPITFAQIEQSPAAPQLFAEYAAESAIAELGTPHPNAAYYAQLEAAGSLFGFGAFVDDELAGFFMLLVAHVPHWQFPTATAESFFVSKAHRKSGAGLKLLRAAETKAKEAGAAGLFISAPVGSVLERVMQGTGYRQTNSVFFKGAAE